MVDIRVTRATSTSVRCVACGLRDAIHEKISIYSEDMICRPALSRLPERHAVGGQGNPRIVDTLEPATMTTTRSFAGDAHPRRDLPSLAGNVSFRFC